MANDKKSGAAKALQAYLQRDIEELNKLNGITKRRRNKKPEKELEEKCLEWLRSAGFSIQVYESKATLSNGVWRNQAMKAGHTDLGGVTPDGIGAFIELKAPGKLLSFLKEKNYRQQVFILEKINAHAFACVVDSVDRLVHIYSEWVKRRQFSKEDARNYLLQSLPKK